MQPSATMRLRAAFVSCLQAPCPVLVNGLESLFFAAPIAPHEFCHAHLGTEHAHDL